MKIYYYGHDFKYELEKLTRLFFPFEKIEFICNEKSTDNDAFYAVAGIDEQNGTYTISVYLSFNNRQVSKTQKISLIGNVPKGQTHENELERTMSVMLFECYSKLTGLKPQWGILTGVRPGKLYRRFCDIGGNDYADSFFKQSFLVSEKKLELLKTSAKGEADIISLSNKKSVSIYLSIPFCPTRCSYCSFVSHSVDKASHLIPQYVELLIKEIEYTAGIVKKLGLTVETVYMGGGTPTTLSAEQLKQVLSAVNENFGGNYREFTVEAGRPDTITAQKLKAIKQCGVNRISINPQTMNDSVLQAIGRNHTVNQTVDAYNLARSIGFKNINMDLIAGLPTDTFEGFVNTVNRIIDLSPESVTVHALALKRASGIVKQGAQNSITDSAHTSQMVDYAADMLSKNSILPYYMYRQSKTVGNLENVGYAKKGFESLYNVYIMDETHTILACGASAVSKLRQPNGNNIKRIFNYKYPYEYINNFDEMLNRKQSIEEFYNEYVFKYK